MWYTPVMWESALPITYEEPTAASMLTMDMQARMRLSRKYSAYSRNWRNTAEILKVRTEDDPIPVHSLSAITNEITPVHPCHLNQ